MREFIETPNEDCCFRARAQLASVQYYIGGSGVPEFVIVFTVGQNHNIQENEACDER